MNQNSSSLKVLTEGFFKTRVRRPVIWDVRRVETVEVPAEGGGHSGPNRAHTQSDLDQSKSKSDYFAEGFVWKRAA